MDFKSRVVLAHHGQDPLLSSTPSPSPDQLHGSRHTSRPLYGTLDGSSRLWKNPRQLILYIHRHVHGRRIWTRRSSSSMLWPRFEHTSRRPDLRSSVGRSDVPPPSGRTLELKPLSGTPLIDRRTSARFPRVDARSGQRSTVDIPANLRIFSTDGLVRRHQFRRRRQPLASVSIGIVGLVCVDSPSPRPSNSFDSGIVQAELPRRSIQDSVQRSHPHDSPQNASEPLGFTMMLPSHPL